MIAAYRWHALVHDAEVCKRIGSANRNHIFQGLQRQTVAATTVYETISCSGCYKRFKVFKLAHAKLPLILWGLESMSSLSFQSPSNSSCLLLLLSVPELIPPNYWWRSNTHGINSAWFVMTSRLFNTFNVARMSLQIGYCVGYCRCQRMQKNILNMRNIVKLYECWDMLGHRSKHVVFMC